MPKRGYVFFVAPFGLYANGSFPLKRGRAGCKSMARYTRNDDDASRRSNWLRTEGPRLFLVFGSAISFFLFFTMLLSSAGFLFSIPITRYHFPAAMIGTIFFVLASSFIFFRKRVIFYTSLSILLLAGTFVISLFLSSRFYDLSYDGQAYHQEAVFHLANGWVPTDRALVKEETSNLHKWINHYAKGVWLYQAALFKFTGKMEMSKVFHLWLMVGAFFMVWSFLLRFEGLPSSFSFLLSLLAACNPVSIYQSQSFYLDGQLMSFLIMETVALGYIYLQGRAYHYALLFFLLPLIVNAKLTAGAYGGVFLAGLLFLLWLRKDRAKSSGILVLGSGAFLAAFLFFGMSPYVTNTVSQKNPFYPVFGPDHSELYKTMNMPGNYLNKDPVTLLFYSIFSKSDNLRGVTSRGELKIPFTFTRNELKAFTDTNAKEGGFGPLFGGVVLLTFVLLGMILISFYRARYKGDEGKEIRGAASKIQIGFICLGTLFLTCAMNPASSLARFIPQMALFPLTAVVLAFLLHRGWTIRIAQAILFILLANNLLVGFSYYDYNVKTSEQYRAKYKELAESSPMNPVKIHFGHFKTSSTLRFSDFGVLYHIVERKEDCREGKRILPNSILLQCP